jgi:hypothetical protein
VSTPPPPDPGTAIEIQKLRGDISTGFAEIKGSLNLLVQRSDQTDRTLGEHRTEMVDLDKRVGELERLAAADAELQVPSRVRTLEAGRWPLPALGALTGLIALGLTTYSALGR